MTEHDGKGAQAPPATLLRPKFRWIVCFAVAYLVAAALAEGTRLIPGVSIVFWPPSGIFVAALLLNPRRSWPWWVATAGAAELTGNILWYQNPWPLALVYSTANAAEALTAAWLVQRVVTGVSGLLNPRRLESPRNAVLFAVLAGVAAPMVGATVIATTDQLLGKHDFWTAWQLVWLGDGMGLLLSAPLTLAAVELWRRRRRIAIQPVLEFLVTGALTVVLTWLALRGQLPTVYLVLPVIVWAAVQFQLLGAWVVLASTILTVGAFTRSGVGEFSGTPDQMHERMVALQVFLGVCSSTALIVAGLSAAHAHGRERLRIANETLERRIRDRTAALADNEQLLRRTLDTAASGLTRCSRDLRYLSANSAYGKIVGLPVEAIVGRPIVEVLGEAAFAIIRPYVEQALRGELVEYEAQVLFDSAGNRYLHVVYTPDVDGAHQVVGWVASITDITDRKRSEDQLRDSEERLGLALSAASAGAWDYDVTNQVAHWSPEMYALYAIDRTTSPVPMNEFVTLIHPDDRDRAVSEMAEAVRLGGPFALEFRAVRPSGETFWVSSTGVVDGGVSRGINQDISVRKAIEERLRDSEQHIQQALRVSRSYTFEWEPASDLIRRSASCGGILQLTGDEAVNDTGQRYFQRVHPDDRARFEALVSGLTPDAPGYSAEYRWIRGDGGVVILEEVGQGSFNAAGVLIRLIGVATDVTARKQAEARLQESETRLQRILTQSPAGIVQADSDGRMTLVNPRWCEMLGYPEDELMGRTLLSVTHASSVAATSEAVGRLAAGGPDFVLEKVYGRKDGSLLQAQSHVTALRAPDGAFLGLIAIVVDVSERLAIEKTAREHAHFLQRVTAVTPGVVQVLDLAERRPVFINRAVESLVGLTPEEVHAMGAEVLPRLMHPDDLPRFEQQLARVRALADGDTCEFEFRMRDRAGQWHWFHATDTVFARDDAGAVRQVIGVAIEITARKRAEIDLARLAAIVESSEDALFSEDLDGMVTTWNRGAERIFGYAADEIVGTSIMRLIPEADQAEEHARQRAIADGQSGGHVESLRVTKTGRVFPAAITISPITDAAGTVIGTSRVVRDITARRHAEEALRQHADALAESDHRKDVFLATLSHELRNPLGVLRSSLHLMRLTGHDRDAVLQACARMERQVVLLARLIDDLMDISRIGQDKLTLQVGRLSLAAVVQSALDNTGTILDQRGHTVSLVLPSQPIEVDGDATRLAQVVSNFLTNAAKYSDPGTPIELTVAQQGETAEVVVRDRGIGIAARDLPRVFDLFAQVGGATHLAQGGLGIGLHLVQRLVELHGGSVEARSDGPGHGSAFVVRLPLASSAARAMPLPAGEAPVPSTSRCYRILVADDNEDAVTTLGMLLRQRGHEVRTARDGAQAVTVAATFQPDVALLDIGMPELDGYEACRRIRALPGGESVVVVAVSGWGREEDKQRARDAGFYQHLVKPVDPAALTALLHALAPTDQTLP